MYVDILRLPDIIFWSLLLTGIVALFYAIKTIWSNRSIQWIYGIRILIFLLLLFGLIQPRFVRQTTTETELPWVMFLDNSLSMNYHSNISQTAINTGLLTLVQQIKDQGITLEILPFSGTIEAEIETPYITSSGTSTDLGKVIQYIKTKKQSGLGGAILISDGQTTQGVDPVSEAKALGVPVYTVAVGDTTPMIDVSVQSIDAPTLVIKGDDVEAKVTIIGMGPINERVNVSLLHGNDLIGSKFIRLHGDGSQNQVNFHFTPTQLGINQYRVATSSLSDEINVENNRLTFDVSVLKDEYYIALMTGVPSQNTPLIKRWLKDQDRVSLSHFIQSSPNYEKTLKNFWPKAYDLIVFDNYPTTPLQLRTQRILAKKIVSQSSSVLWINGPNVDEKSSSSIFPLLHVVSTTVADSIDTDIPGVIRLNEYMAKLPVYIGGYDSDINEYELPPLAHGLAIKSNHDQSWPLIEFSDSQLPVLLLNEKESLRSALWTTQDINQFHYKMMYTGETVLSGNIFEGIVAWLMKTGGDQDLYFRMNKNVFQQGEEVHVTGNKIGEKSSPYSEVSLSVIKDSVLVNTYEFQYNSPKNRWEGSFWASAPGTYDYEISMVAGKSKSSQKGKFIVEESQIELNKVFVNTTVLKSISEETNGKFISWYQRGQLIPYLKESTQFHKNINKFLPTESWWSLIIIIVLLGCEWGLRRFRGLI
ncbi:MAG: VWA domain-containing protein [Candidatus Marinimicrobia bacterium]|nr:VWA domain-containing protein [Candidatus Neomarinimicrobiota bacterium]